MNAPSRKFAVTTTTLPIPHQARFRDLVELHLRQPLPLDEERRTEMAVFLVIGAAALSDPAVRPIYHRVDGLALHLLRQPAHSGTTWATDVLHARLDQLTSPR